MRVAPRNRSDERFTATPSGRDYSVARNAVNAKVLQDHELKAQILDGAADHSRSRLELVLAVLATQPLKSSANPDSRGVVMRCKSNPE